MSDYVSILAVAFFAAALLLTMLLRRANEHREKGTHEAIADMTLNAVFIAIIMIISPIYTLVVGIQNGTINGWQPILQYVGQFALPLLYFIGFLLI